VRLAPLLPRQEYPGPQARASNDLHEVDLVGPIYLKGRSHRYYIWVGKDAFDGAVCLRLAYSRRMDEVLGFLGECWKDRGRPAQVQLDNARELAGWGPSAVAREGKARMDRGVVLRFGHLRRLKVYTSRAALIFAYAASCQPRAPRASNTNTRATSSVAPARTAAISLPASACHPDLPSPESTVSFAVIQLTLPEFTVRLLYSHCTAGSCRPFRHPELAGHFLMRPALQVAQNQDHPVFVRQATQLVIQQGSHVGPPVLPHGLGIRQRGHLDFPRPPSGGGPAGVQGRPVGHPVQPVPDQRPRRYGRRLADEDEEGGLEGILGVVVVQEAATHAPHHRAVPPDEGGEGRVVVTVDERAEQFGVGRTAPVRQQHRPTKVLDHAAHRVGRHGLSSVGAPPPSACYLPQGGDLIHDFLDPPGARWVQGGRTGR
jgi:hypothetical protein